MSTVGKAIKLLECFSANEPQIGLSGLARKTGFDKATTRRLLVSLAEHGLVAQDVETRLYRLGAGLSRLARIREEHIPFLQVAAPVVRALHEETEETVHLTEYSADTLSTTLVELSPKANRVNVDVGQMLPLHSTASGIAFLSAARPEVREAYLAKPLPAYTRYTVTDRDTISAAIEQAGKNGYSQSAQGYEEGIFSVAAPIIGPDGYAMGTLAVASPISRSNKQTTVRCGKAVARAAQKISTLLNEDTTRHPGNRPTGVAPEPA